MKIAVFGASGRSGRLFVREALEKGHHIKALVRNPGNFNYPHSNLEIIQGDFAKAEDVEECITGTDIVVSLVGHVKGSEAGFQTRGTQYVLDAMKAHKVNRIISLTGGAVADPEWDKPKTIDKMIRFIMKNLAGKGTRNALLDGRSHAELIRSFEGEWTIVRAPMLTNDPAKGLIKVGHVGTISGFKLSREDLADFLLKEVDEKKYIRKLPFVSNG